MEDYYLKQIRKQSAIHDVSPRKTCLPCRHCKVMRSKLNNPMSFLCFKGKFDLTTNQEELSKHINCPHFDYEG